MQGARLTRAWAMDLSFQRIPGKEGPDVRGTPVFYLLLVDEYSRDLFNSSLGHPIGMWLFVPHSWLSITVKACAEGQAQKRGYNKHNLVDHKQVEKGPEVQGTPVFHYLFWFKHTAGSSFDSSLEPSIITGLNWDICRRKGLGVWGTPSMTSHKVEYVQKKKVQKHGVYPHCIKTSRSRQYEDCKKLVQLGPGPCVVIGHII
ncbi:hypothetical protein DFH08DRAFT_807973 [Mycena albidolilacea]|uniref:Uncharacterized protein n=1 Tax=Mycena albidolilacea TaxID=1033008 RepID=A0AAD7A3H5_9AGAR|nr:hypothetical protein DFH08DRAFT_807973 [Mycena albidolilacea]